MISSRLFLNLNRCRSCLCGLRKLANGNGLYSSNKNTSDQTSLGDMGSKYQVFKDQDAEVILDVYEERLKYSSLLEEEEDHYVDPFEGLNLESK